MPSWQVFSRYDHFSCGPGDFVQLFLVGDTASCATPVATKVLGEIVAGKPEKRNAFTETVLLTEIMRQQSGSPSARQFRQASEIRDPLLARISDSLAVKVHIIWNSMMPCISTLQGNGRRHRIYFAQINYRNPC